VISKEEYSKTFVSITSKNSASGPELEFILYKKQVFDIINLDPCG
jgi:hypothetical protein